MTSVTRINASGIEVPLLVTEAKGEVQYILLLLPALGIRAKFYTKLAVGLSAHGISTVVMEQRGNGESPYRPGDGTTFGLRDYMNVDISAATDWVQTYYPNTQIYIGGHSLGGHMASLAGVLKPDLYAGIARLACGFPFYKDFPQPRSSFIKLMIMMIPLFAKFPGYFPGNRLGFGGREYSGLMMDWRLWAKSGQYENDIFPGSNTAMATYDKKVVSLGFEQDLLAPDAAIDRSIGQFISAPVTRVKLGAKVQGEYLGHINWGRQPGGVVAALAEWIQD